MRVLLVEDQPELAAWTATGLMRRGFAVDRAFSVEEAVMLLERENYAVAVLDRGLPDGDGLEVVSVLRKRAAAPRILCLTSWSDLLQRVEGLDGGADDYLVKPADLDELAARLRALSRRPDRAGEHVVRAGRLSFDVGARAAEVGGAPLVLGGRELAALDMLVRRAGRVVAREHLEAAVYGLDDEVAPNALEAVVSRLRRRLAETQAGLEVRAVRGVGYVLMEGR